MRRPGSGSGGSFAQVYRPRENASSSAPSQQGQGGGAMQNLDKVLQSAERLANSPPTNSPSSRPVMGRQQSFTPVNGANSSAVKSKPVAPKTPPQTNFPKPPESSTAVKVSQDLPKAPPQTDVSASKQAPPAAPFPRVSSSQTPAPAPSPGVSSSPQTPAPAPSPGVSPSSQAPAPAPSPGVSPSSLELLDFQHHQELRFSARHL
ncbi:vegetative cell wall protein gp1-like [Selaginella moellendorffii]|uniref:vegetative cell wall protein gp1-like n=1 Tax=Selaginella moellendorffii TaxID=88036 RepID=UPI000D1C864B|nr:vegetative cell wall protein gp1-like [Selaginella moellendorffii]|eukprot:XP_024520743.1 vegetative cell wall protein gp1-like [Selaginella moellendorffii]